MKSRLTQFYKFLILFVLLIPQAAFSQSVIQELSSMNIYEGSAEEELLIQYLRSHVGNPIWQWNEQEYMESDLLHSFGKSIYLTKEGSGNSHLILVISINSNSEIENAPWIFLIDLLRELEISNSSADLSILLLTGENPQLPVGTTHYLDQVLQDPERTGLIYFDLRRDLDSLALTAGSSGQLSALWMVESLVAELESQQIEIDLDSTELQVHRSSYSSDTAHISPYLDHGIPAVLLESMDPEQEEWSGRENLIAAITSFYVNFNEIDHESSERNYFILKFNGKSIFIAERDILFIYLGFFCLTLLLTLFQYRKIVLNIRKYQNQLWMVFIALFLMFLFLLLSTLLLEELGYLLRDNNIWVLVPLPALALKLGLTFIFASFFLFILRGMGIPRKPHFYSYSAFLFAFVNLVVFSLLEITLSFFWIWTLLFTLLFTLSRRQVPKIITLVVIPLPFIIAMLNILQDDFPRVHSLFIQSRLGGNFFLALNLMPFILLLTSLHYSKFYYKKERRSLVGPMSIILALAATLALFYFFITESNRIAQENQRIKIVETIDLNTETRTLILEADQPLGDLEILGFDNPVSLRNLDRSLELELPPPLDWLSFESDAQLFLDRQNHSIILTPIGQPVACEIEISSEAAITLYDCNYPFEVNPQGTRITLLIGRYPPIPFPLEVTLNRHADAVLHCRFIYQDFPYNFKINSAIPYDLEALTILQDFSL